MLSRSVMHVLVDEALAGRGALPWLLIEQDVGDIWRCYRRLLLLDGFRIHRL